MFDNPKPRTVGGDATIRIRVDGARGLPKPGLVQVAGQVVAGDLGLRTVVRSVSTGDVWEVGRIGVAHLGPPTAYDRGEDGKCNLLFRPLGGWRRIAVDEVFTEVTEPEVQC
jgi:hypothetical protein